VKDRVFTGADVEEAVASAAASLGLPLRELRYVVLDQGVAGGRGLQPTPARIAVLLQDPGSAARAPRVQAGGTAPVEPAGPRDVAAGVRAIVRALAAAGRLEVDVEIDDAADAFVVFLRGKDAAFFHGDLARGDVLEALGHLLDRAFGEDLRPRRLRLRCEGFREARDAALAEDARRVAAEVRASGEAQTMEPLNAYERRIVHLTLQEEPGVRTFSVGEGMDRRVTVAPAEAGPPTPGEGEA
jgi:spoIIIJ-associated protein